MTEQLVALIVQMRTDFVIAFSHLDVVSVTVQEEWHMCWESTYWVFAAA
jgi:hypothetical protein